MPGRIIIPSGASGPSVVQSASDVKTNSALSATLPAAPTPGNLLVVGFSQQGGPIGLPSNNVGNALTLVPSGDTAYCTDGFNGCTLAYYRRVQSGDGASYGFANGTFATLVVVEFAGTDPAGSIGSVNLEAAQNGPTLALDIAPPSSAYGVFGVYTTRQISAAMALAPNSDTLVALIQAMTADGAWSGGTGILYGQGSITLGGTLSGSVKDVNRWAGHKFAFPLAASGGGQTSFGKDRRLGR